MSQDYDAIAADFVATRNRPWEEFECWRSDLETFKAARCLDLGCGGGRFRDWLPKKIVPEGHYFGQDISAEMIQLARAKFSAENFQIGSMTDLSAYEDASMEVVSAIASFHHLLSATEQRQCLAEVFRVLKPGGFFLATSWVLPQRFFLEEYSPRKMEKLADSFWGAEVSALVSAIVDLRLGKAVEGSRVC